MRLSEKGNLVLKLVFLGPPGAGKGTQAARMAEQFALKHASTGEIFRNAAAAGSELGQTVRAYLDAGKLVPDELTSRVVEEMALDRVRSYILDGYPRTLPQAQELDRILEQRGEVLDAALCFDLREEEAVRRLTGRLVCTGCGANYHRLFMPPRHDEVCDRCGANLMVRTDSSEEVVRRRLAEYDAKTKPLVPYYEGKGLLHRIDASRGPDIVSESTRRLLNALSGGSRP